MRRLFSAATVTLLIVVLLTAGCDLFNRNNTPTTPTATGSLNTFAGAWASSSSTAPALTSCGNLKYTVAPVNQTTATISYSGTCAGLAISGAGTGTLSGSDLEWTAQGVVSQGGVNCPFTFTNNKATAEGTDGLKLTYSGTVCGLSVSGSEVVKRQ